MSKKPCLHDPAKPGCRVCYLYDHDPKHRQLWGGGDMVQVACTADGVGDALLGLTSTAGLSASGKFVHYALLGTARKGADWQRPFVELFGGYGSVGTTLLSGVQTYFPHETYHQQNATKLAKSRWQWYADACGTTAVLPQLRPLPDDAVEWAEQYRGCVILAPFSAWQVREWSLSHWIFLEKLLMGQGLRVVIIDGRTNKWEQLRSFSSTLIVDESASRVAALLRVADCFVGQDSGMSHLAGLCGTPGLILSAQIKAKNIFGIYPSLELLDGPMSCGGCHWGGPNWSSKCDTLCANLQAIYPPEVARRVGMIVGRTLLSSDRLATLIQTSKRCCSLPGDMAELGSYRGGSARVISQACPSKKLHVFDTFAGIPEDDVNGGVHKKGEFSANVLDVKRYLSGCNVEFHVGFFPETTAGLEDTRYSFIHLDGDLYQSTKAGIEYFWPRLSEGGCIVFDDFGWRHCPGVEASIKELLPGFVPEITAGIQCRICKPVSSIRKGCGCDRDGLRKTR